MKALKLVILISLCATLLPVIALAEDQVPKISVTGIAKKKVTPDQIEWSVVITTKDKNLESLSSKHNNISSRVLDSLRGLGVEKENLKTSRMRFNEDWNYSGGKRFKDGFVATTNLNFKFSDFSNYLAVWKKLSKFEQVAVNSANFSYSKSMEVQKELKNKALLNAKDKAESMAKTLGVSVGQVLYISEAGYKNIAPRYNALASESRISKAQAPIEPGSTEISSSVLVDFRIINN